MLGGPVTSKRHKWVLVPCPAERLPWPLRTHSICHYAPAGWCSSSVGSWGRVAMSPPVSLRPTGLGCASCCPGSFVQRARRLATWAHAHAAARSVVTVTHHDLVTNPHGLRDAIRQAFGPDQLGFLTVSGVPDLQRRRRALLPLARRVAHLPDEVLRTYEDAPSRYSFGWSRGKERLDGDRADVHKGSWYNNPLTDDAVTDDVALQARYPGMLRANIWPDAHVPEMREAFRSLGTLVIQVGALVARACDAYVEEVQEGRGGALESAVRDSRNPKARLLHYYPTTGGEGDDANWCSVHTDHGSLTGLTSALWEDADGREVPCPDPAAGLYVVASGDTHVQVRIPEDHLGFQLGQSIQIESGGTLMATPHYVRAPRGAAGVSRSTFAVFMQPSWDRVLAGPPGVPPERCRAGPWEPGMTFGEFAEKTFGGYY